jgi:hypothetical protein
MLLTTKHFSWLNPMTRRQAVTVRQPSARIAPTIKTLAYSQTGLENRGANSTSNGNNSAGSVCNLKISRGKSGLQLTLSAIVFSKIKNGQS